MCALDISKIIVRRLWNCRIARVTMTMAVALWRAWKPNYLKRGCGDLSIGSMRSLRRKLRPHLANMLEFGFSLEISPYGPFGYRGTISFSTKLDGLWRNHQTIWQELCDYAHVMCELAFKSVKNSYLVKFSTILWHDLGGNKLLYYRSIPWKWHRALWRPTWVLFVMLRIVTLLGVFWFYNMHPREFPWYLSRSLVALWPLISIEIINLVVIVSIIKINK